MFNDDHNFMSDCELNEMDAEWGADFEDTPDFDGDHMSHEEFTRKLDNDPAYHEWLDEMGK